MFALLLASWCVRAEPADSGYRTEMEIGYRSAWYTCLIGAPTGFIGPIASCRRSGSVLVTMR